MGHLYGTIEKAGISGLMRRDGMGKLNAISAVGVKDLSDRERIAENPFPSTGGARNAAA